MQTWQWHPFLFYKDWPLLSSTKTNAHACLDYQQTSTQVEKARALWKWHSAVESGPTICLSKVPDAVQELVLLQVPFLWKGAHMPPSDGSERPVLHQLCLPWPSGPMVVAMWQTGLAEPRATSHVEWWSQGMKAMLYITLYRGSLGRQSLLPLQQDNPMSGDTTLATSSSCVISCVQRLNQLFLLPSCFGQSNRWTLHRVQSSTLLLYDQPVKRRRSMCEKGLPTYVTEEKYAAG